MAQSTNNQSNSNLLTYVLITPARNEAAFIEQTILSVVHQTVLPLRWVIVSDGSTDGTDEIVRKYASEHPWIELVRMPERKERHFAGKVYAFNSGYARVKELEFDIVANLDADISFGPDHFEFLLAKFAADQHLGVAGTPFSEAGATYDYRFTSKEHVSGACQLFRRGCFDSIGGYTPLKVGGIDLVAVTTARMKRWNTQTFPDKICHHHKMTQSGKNFSVKATFKSGFHDYLMGSHAMWQVFRSIYQMGRSPLVLGGAALMSGYLWAMATRAERPVSREFAEFRAKEQMNRLKDFIRRLVFRAP
jgi:glycosyltransferase involved in cell wall biosynthesis